jgi:hypothetical protein
VDKKKTGPDTVGQGMDDTQIARRDAMRPGGRSASTPPVILLGDGTRADDSNQPNRSGSGGGFSADAPYGDSEGPLFNDLADGSEDPLAEPVDLRRKPARRNAPSPAKPRTHTSSG